MALWLPPRGFIIDSRARMVERFARRREYGARAASRPPPSQPENQSA